LKTLDSQAGHCRPGLREGLWSSPCRLLWYGVDLFLLQRHQQDLVFLLSHLTTIERLPHSISMLRQPGVRRLRGGYHPCAAGQSVSESQRACGGSRVMALPLSYNFRNLLDTQAHNRADGIGDGAGRLCLRFHPHAGQSGFRKPLWRPSYDNMVVLRKGSGSEVRQRVSREQTSVVETQLRSHRPERTETAGQGNCGTSSISPRKDTLKPRMSSFGHRRNSFFSTQVRLVNGDSRAGFPGSDGLFKPCQRFQSNGHR